MLTQSRLSSNDLKMAALFFLVAAVGVFLPMGTGDVAAMSGAPPPLSADEKFTNSAGMTFVLIPPMEFPMGSPPSEPMRSEDENQHSVTLTRSFFIQTTEVTQAQWEAVMEDNPAEFRQCADCPVENVSWQDVQSFIDRLNRKERDHGYRLPTEAEWEAACRCGTRTPYYWGECLDTQHVNFEGNYPLPGCRKQGWRKTTTPVDALSPNAWHLFGMHGNVSEWVQDWYGPYTADAVTDPTGPATGSTKVIRGGSWRNGASQCRSAIRKHGAPAVKNHTIGFRLVLDPF